MAAWEKVENFKIWFAFELFELLFSSLSSSSNEDKCFKTPRKILKIENFIKLVSVQRLYTQTHVLLLLIHLFLFTTIIINIINSIYYTKQIYCIYICSYMRIIITV